MVLNYAIKKFIQSDYEHFNTASSLCQRYIAVSQTDHQMAFVLAADPVFVTTARRTRVTFHYLILQSA
jgi:hypothetical protein